MADEEEKPPHLPLDIIAKIPTHISDPASLARAASSHKLWRDLIKDPAFLDGLRNRHGDHGFTPFNSLLLGFFYQESSEAPSHLWQHHADQHRCLAPSFLHTSEFLPQLSGSREEGCNAASRPMSLASFFQGVDAHANFYKPVASQGSYLALRRGVQDLQVCNPLTGQLFHVPKRWDRPPPQHYALLVADDDDSRVRQSFRLVAIWIKGNKVIYVYYCSKTRRWKTPTSTPEVRAGLYLMTPSHAADSSHGSGSIHWLCGSWKSMAPTHVATLWLEEEELLYVELPPEAKRSSKAPPLLSTSADGGVLLLLLKGLQMSLWKHKSSSWVLSERIDMAGSLPMRALTTQAKIRLEIFRGKSGAVVVWVEGEGLFLFCLADRSMRKIDSENVARRYFFCPYEIDWLSCLAVTNLVVDGWLDEARAKIHRRWKTLIANDV